MALREFSDDRGRRWTVWDVYPTLLNRDEKSVRPVEPRAESSRTESNAQMPLGAVVNWLAFEAHDGERRRLLPIPASETMWFDASDAQLCTWCDMARLVPPTRRLIE